MFFEQALIGQMANFGYLIGDPEAKVAAVIDPSFDARILQRFGRRFAFQRERADARARRGKSSDRAS